MLRTIALLGLVTATCTAVLAGDSSTPGQLPVATVRSSGRLIVNGIVTPPGVNSVIVAPGDLISTMDGAILVFRDGKTASLSPAQEYRVPGRSVQRLDPTGAPMPIGFRPLKITPPQISQSLP